MRNIKEIFLRKNIFLSTFIFSILFAFELFALDVQFICQNKFSKKLLEKIIHLDKKNCKYLPKKKFGKNMPYCDRYKLTKRKKNVCQILIQNNVINWSYQQFINIPHFSFDTGIAYKYTVPCWEYGSKTSTLIGYYTIRNNILRFIDKNSKQFFSINLKNLKAGYGNNRSYKCILNF
tara:strand:- start:977 stop:1507 length:531 start_codon:yes stop_codon:yes gene_type:complete